ncbi:MAG: hypothetical protein LC659_14670 [Myxococcales bacterium]|nr:hypothetical protein [Myxococcales bacterium]
MGRWCCGLVIAAAFAAGCAAAATPESMQQSTGDSDLGGGAYDFAGGIIVSNCMDGGSCATGSPGDCSMGHAVCSGDVQSCVPDVTTQRCYDGPAGTINKGVCKAGTQTCIGALGSCDGEVKPAAAENCFNDLDDDCDGTVNNGCPTALATGTPRALTAHGDTGTGTAFSLRCPAGSFVSKAVMFGDNSVAAVTSLDVYCGTPTLARGTSSYSVSVAVAATALSVGTDRGGPMTTFTCNGGFSPGWQTTGTAVNGANGGIDGYGLNCANTTVALDATNKLTFMQVKAAAGSSSGNNPDGYLATASFEDDCAAGEVLVGYDGKLGTWITYFQAICAPLQVVYK